MQPRDLLFYPLQIIHFPWFFILATWNWRGYLVIWPVLKNFPSKPLSFNSHFQASLRHKLLKLLDKPVKQISWLLPFLTADLGFNSPWFVKSVTTDRLSASKFQNFVTSFPILSTFQGLCLSIFLIMELNIFKHRWNNMTHHVPSFNCNNYSFMSTSASSISCSLPNFPYYFEENLRYQPFH